MKNVSIAPASPAQFFSHVASTLLAYNLSLTKSLDPAMKRIYLLAAILFTGLLAACGSTTSPAPKANLRVMHASPNGGLLDISLDDKKILRNFMLQYYLK